MESIRELRTICQKGDKEAFVFFRVLVRPVSIYITRVCLALGISANVVSVLSVVSAVSAAVLLVSQDLALRFLAGLLLFFYTVLDGVDGEVARYRLHHNQAPPGKAGPYADAMAHLLSFNLALFGLGLGLYVNTGQLGFVVAGFLASFMHSRVQHAAAHEVIIALLPHEHERTTLAARFSDTGVHPASAFARLREGIVWPFPMGLVLPLILTAEWLLQPAIFLFSAWFLGLYVLVSLAMFARSVHKQYSLFRSL